jgi:hypothetical protein
VANYPYWDGKVHKRARFGDISIKGTAKGNRMKLQRQRFARRDAEAAIATAEIEAARSARLPWPVRAIGAVLDFTLRRPSPRDRALREERPWTFVGALVNLIGRG